MARWQNGSGQWRPSRACSVDGAARALASRTDGRPEDDGDWQLVDRVEVKHGGVVWEVDVARERRGRWASGFRSRVEVTT